MTFLIIPVSIIVIILVSLYFLFRRKEDFSYTFKTYKDMTLDQLRTLFLKRYKEFSILEEPSNKNILELTLSNDIDYNGLYKILSYPYSYWFEFLSDINFKAPRNRASFEKDVKQYYVDVLEKTEHPYTEEELILCKKYFGASFLKVYYEEVKKHE